MRLAITVIPGAKATRVERDATGRIRIWVAEPPTEGRANAAALEALAAYLGIPRSRLRIVRGAASRYKVVDVR